MHPSDQCRPSFLLRETPKRHSCFSASMSSNCRMSSRARTNSRCSRPSAEHASRCNFCKELSAHTPGIFSVLGSSRRCLRASGFFCGLRAFEVLALPQVFAPAAPSFKLRSCGRQKTWHSVLGHGSDDSRKERTKQAAIETVARCCCAAKPVGSPAYHLGVRRACDEVVGASSCSAQWEYHVATRNEAPVSPV